MSPCHLHWNRCIRCEPHSADYNAQRSGNVQGHSASPLAATAQAGMSIGRKGMFYAAECMAAGAYRLVTEPELLERALDEMKA